MPRPANFFTTLNGVPVHYDRLPLAEYGSRGKPYDFHATKEFEDKLDACFAELEQTCPLGRPEVITSAGAWVDKDGEHGKGKAFDLDGIHWSNRKFVCLNFPNDRHFYIGVEAVLRKFFPTVLNYYFNTDHHDHLHMDLSRTLAFKRSRRSQVFFLQSALTHVLEIPVDIDGGWGPQTAGATTQALAELNIDGQLENLETWMQFLDAVSARAFQEVEPPPVDSEEIPTDATVVAKQVTVRKQQVGNKMKWFGKIDDEPEFLVGRESFFQKQNGRGLSLYDGLKYNPDDYRADYGFWADFIYPTSFCESEQGFFNALNTWDRAHFTFGFMQFGAHEFDGDFARYLRGLLALPEAAAYFPELVLKNERVHRKVNGSLVNLETNTKPTKLAVYLNPDFHVIESIEAENAARFIHWTNNSLASRKLQVEIAIKIFRQILRGHTNTYSLDGKPDKVCLVIADIHHQGRAGEDTVPLIKQALATNGNMEKAYQNLLQIGKADYAPRIATLKNKIDAMLAQGKLGKMKYSKAQHDFVPSS